MYNDIIENPIRSAESRIFEEMKILNISVPRLGIEPITRRFPTNALQSHACAPAPLLASKPSNLLLYIALHLIHKGNLTLFITQSGKVPVSCKETFEYRQFELVRNKPTVLTVPLSRWEWNELFHKTMKLFSKCVYISIMYILYTECKDDGCAFNFHSRK